MRIRTMIGVTSVAAASSLAAGPGAASAQPARTCTWGGTPLAPTGLTTNNFSSVIELFE